jgi:uncharacterized protein YndB with AHSA1/START domain
VDDTSIVDREVRIEAPPDVVAAFFTDPAKIATWMASRARVDPRARGRLRLEFDRADGTTDVVVGEFVEITSRRIVFTWGFEGRAELEAEGSGTRVRLVHRDLPDTDREAHAGGWTYFLERLASAARAP